MKIGLFTDSYLPSHDGVATTVASLAKELKKLGHEVYVVAPSYPHFKDRKNVFRILSVRVFKEPEIRMGLEIPQTSVLKVSAIDFDIIHGHSGGPVSLLGWQIAQVRNIPFVETYHTMWRQYSHYFPFPKMFSVWFLKKLSVIFGNDCDGLIAPSERVKDELLGYGVKKPIYVVPSGIYLDNFKNHKKGFLHKKINLKDDMKIVLSVGRLEKEKSMDFLISAFSVAAKKHPDIVLVLVGEGRDKKRLEELAKDIDIHQKVFFMEPVSFEQMPQVYADADIFVFSSKTETQGMVVVEALASGLPVVAVEDRVIADVIINGKNGFLTKKDPEVFGRKVHEALKDSNLYYKLKSDTKKSIVNYSIDNTAKAIEQVYLSLLANENAKNNTFWDRISKLILKHRVLKD